MKDFSGQKASSEKFDFSFSDIDFETDVLMPRINLSNNIKVLGDYFSEINKEKSVKSTFRMYIDYEEVIKSAFAAAKKETRAANDVTECNKQLFRQQQTFNEERLRKNLEAERDEKLEEFNN